MLPVVGFCEVLQHIPRAVTAAPPSLVTLPPLVAAVENIPETAVVVTTGNKVLVVNDRSSPYDVPARLTA